MTSTSPHSGRTIRMGRMTRHNLLMGLLFISPWLIGFLILTLYPIVASAYYSLTRYDAISPPEFVGLGNYVDLFTKNPLFWQAVGNTVYYAAIAIPLNICIAIGVALLLNMEVRGRSIYRTIFFLPSIVPDIAAAMLWAWILNPQFGLANAMLKALGLPTIGWLTDPDWSKPSLILINAWAFGGSVVIFLAALQDIPRQLYEAADLDGANAWVRTRYITLPMLTPVIFFNLINGIIGAFQYFTNAYVITGGQGGPAGSTTFYSLLLYRNAFSYFKMGYASAMAWILFAAVFVMTLLLFKSSGRWVYYEGGDNN
ncbi:MAG: sugar ABC transporter permease [Anaerolineae bacterium]|nr:sugar ABC transporter permease [Anaerolineae bacterium]